MTLEKPQAHVEKYFKLNTIKFFFSWPIQADKLNRHGHTLCSPTAQLVELLETKANAKLLFY